MDGRREGWEAEERMAEVAVPTYNATIYVGLKERASGRSIDAESVLLYLQTYVSTHGRGTPAGCVSMTPTRFVYVDVVAQPEMEKRRSPLV